MADSDIFPHNMSHSVVSIMEQRKYLIYIYILISFATNYLFNRMKCYEKIRDICEGYEKLNYILLNK